MQNSIRELIDADRNALSILGVPPSTTNADIRRAIERLRLESSVGLNDISMDSLEEAEQALSREPSRFEMRMFSDWDDDPVLHPWAGAHARFLDGLAATCFDQHPPDDALDAWLDLVEEPGLVDACTEFAPDGLEPGPFWGDCAAAIVRAGDAHIERDGGVALLKRMSKTKGVPPTGVISFVSGSVQSQFEEVSRLLDENTGRPDGGLTKKAAKRVSERYRAAASTADAVQGALTRWEDANDATVAEAAADASESIAHKAHEVGSAAAVALHNKGDYARAEQVLLAELDLALGDAEYEQAKEGLRIVRLMWAQSEFESAMQHQDFECAVNALDDVLAVTTDPEERAVALAGRARLQDAIRIQNRPVALKVWFALRGWLIAAAIIGAIIVVGVLADEGDSSGGATSSSSGGASGSNSSSSSSDGALTVPSVGDCVRTGTGSTVNLRIVSCSSANDGQVVGVFRLVGFSYPAQSTIDLSANRQCPVTSDYYVYPSRDTWSLGDRTVICVRD